MSEALISIIVPVFNTAKYLEQCLDSLVNQTYKNIEIICINDESKDNSLEILKQYAENDNRVIIIDKPNEGVSVARNTALEIVKGQYIMFVDSDDWIDLNTCEDILKTAQMSESDVVMWGYSREFGEISKTKSLIETDIRTYDQRECREKLHRRMIGLVDKELAQPEKADMLCTVWCKLYRAEIILDNNIQFEDIRDIGTYEDGIFNLYVFEYVIKAVYVNKYYYHYRKLNSDSITSRYKPSLPKMWERLFDLMEEYIINKQLDDNYTKALQNRISLSILGLGLNALSESTGFKNKVKSIGQILKSDRYRNAIKQLPLKYFPLHWKLFYACAKYKFAFGVYILLIAIRKIIRN